MAKTQHSRRRRKNRLKRERRKRNRRLVHETVSMVREAMAPALATLAPEIVFKFSFQPGATR